MAVQPFSERRPIGISGLLSTELARALAAGGVRLTHEVEAADAVLQGTVLSEYTRPAPSAPGTTVAAYMTRVTIEARLVGGDGEVLWRTRFDFDEDFLPTTGGGVDALGAETARRQALRRLTERAARDIHSALVLEAALGGGAS